jgi:EmrB/QacA subfamily drug resistance transporter
MMGGIDTTIVVLAIPTMMTELKADLSAVVWVILVYIIVVTILATQLGRLGDIRGRAKMFNLGMLSFAIGSALAGASVSIQELVAFRAAQAVGGALMVSNSMALISDYFGHQRRGYAFGWTTFGWNVGAIAGIMLGGILTTFISWRWVFYVTLPLGLLGFVLGIKYLHEVRMSVKRKFDLFGSSVMGIALTLISIGALNYPEEGLGSDTLLFLVVGLAFLVVFFFLERRSRDPVLDITLFGVRLFTASAFASFLQFTANFAVLFLLTMYLQGARGLDPFRASLYLVPGYMVGSIVGSFGGRLADVRDPRAIATIGLALQMLSYISYFLLLTPSVTLYLIIGSSTLSSIGSSLFFSSNGKLVMADVPQDRYGMASGMYRTMNNMGMVSSFVVAVVASASAIPKELAFQIFIGTTTLSVSLLAPFVESIRSTFLISALVMGIAVILSWVRSRVHSSSLPSREKM